MTITSIPFEPAAPSRLMSFLFDDLRRLAEALITNTGALKSARAIRKLSEFDERELDDIGLTRSDLTSDRFAQASVRRAAKQAAINSETVAHG